MDPRTHPRGTAPDFTLPQPNPNPQRVTDALWWLRCMRLRLEPLSEDGGILAIKPGYHSYGSRLPDYGVGDARTDHSIRRAPDRVGPWWKQYASAHDWTFDRAHGGNYTEINKYMKRRIDAMRSLTDLRPDDVYAYTIGQLDGDVHVEGWNEYKDAEESGNSSHLWHIHDSFRRGIIGNFWAMWKALTIDMGWTYAEWLASTAPPKESDMKLDPDDIKAIGHEVWDKKRWSATDPISTASAVQQASRADDALREVQELRKVVDAQGALLAEILLRLPGGPVA
jgi:hypothetical protein